MAQAKVELRRAELQLTQLREVVDLQYEQALGEKERIRATIAARQRTVEQAQRVYDLTVLRYEQGLATQLEVSDSRLALLQARTNLAQALADFYISDAGVTGATPGSGNVAPAIQPRMPGTGAVNQPPNPIRFFQIASPLGSPNDARRLDDPQARQQ
jgi:outer membrane protein TolC